MACVGEDGRKPLRGKEFVGNMSYNLRWAVDAVPSCQVPPKVQAGEGHCRAAFHMA